MGKSGASKSEPRGTHPWRRVVTYVLRLCVSALLLCLVARRVQPDAFLRTVRDANKALFAAALLLSFLVRALMSAERALVARELGMALRLRQLFRINLVSTFYSLVLPGDVAGGVAAWYKVARAEAKPVEAMTLVVFCRLLDLGCVLAFGLGAMCLSPPEGVPELRLAAGVSLVLVVAAIACFLLPQGVSLVRGLERRLPRGRLGSLVATPLRRLCLSLEAYRRMPARSSILLLFLVFSVGCLGTFLYWLLALAAGIDAPFLVIAWLRCAVLVIQLMPLTFCGLGLREIGLEWLLRPYGVPETQAVTYSLAVFSTMLVAAGAGAVLEFVEWLVPSPRRSGPSERSTCP